MEIRIRRLESNMITIGTGIIAFGFWSFIKFVLTFFIMGSEYVGITDDQYRTFLMIFVWAFAALSALVYLWIGLSARAEGKGKHKSVLYLIMLGVIILFSSVVIVLEILSLTSLTKLDEMIVTLIIDVTRMVFLVELMIYSITLRILRKRQRAGEGSKA
ncbi:MAG: hypothetical protein IJG87_05850 [Ruminococcus sp.]|nr:hypothetical protein [Ruminococcus sp.]